MKARIFATVFLLAVAFLAYGTGAHAQWSDPASVLAAAQAQVNAGNLDLLMGYFADGAVATNDGTVYSGKDKVKEFMGGALGDHLQAKTLGDYQVSGNKVVWVEQESAGSLRQLGISTVTSNNEATVVNGKITSITFTTSPESLAQIQAASSPAGMPKTGEGRGMDLWWVGAAGLALVLLGLALITRRPRGAAARGR